MNRTLSNFFAHKKATKRQKNELKGSTSKIQRVAPKKKPSQETGIAVTRPRERETEQQSTAGSQSVRQKPSKNKKKNGTKEDKEEESKPKVAALKSSAQNCYTPPAGTPIPEESKLSPATSRQNLASKSGVLSKETPSTKTTSTAPIVPLAQNNSMLNVSASSTTVGTSENAWIGASVAKTFLEKADFSKAKSDFETISNMPVEVEKDCKKWAAHPKDNQSDEFPVLDSKLVKADEYVNMSHVEVPLHRNLLIGQIPKPGREEAFWKAVFDQRAMCIHLMIGDGEKYDFFPLKSGDFMHYGSMFVNNRRVEGVNDDIVRFAVEVLPAGCSNSIITNVTIIKNWNMDSVHAKYACVLKETIELNNFLSTSQADETALVMSKHGAGRSGYFIALTIAVTKLDQKIEPNILEIVKAIRAQRPRTVDSLPQYASLYISMFYFIKRKMSKTADGDKKAASDTSDPLCKKAIQMTHQFITGLVEEAAASSAKSTYTSVS